MLNSDEFIKENTNTNISDINIQKMANSISINLKNYISDEFIYNIHTVDKDLILNISRKVLF